MFDPITLVAGAALVTAGWITGRMRNRSSSSPQQPANICSCGHGYGSHAENGGQCVTDVQRPHYHKGGTRNGYEWASCACLVWTGLSSPPPPEVS